MTRAEFDALLSRVEALEPQCEPQPEVCDYLDNDCDGQVDEDFDLDSDPSNCGGCGVVCGPDQVCTNFHCVAETPSKVVFVTEAASPGSSALGHPVCQQEAEAAGLDGTFLAWLSTDTFGPYQMFTKSEVPYVLPSGTIVATDWADLTDGSLVNPINESAAGYTIAECPVWTATLSNGEPTHQDTCSNWTTDGGVGGIGMSSYTTAAWSEGGVQPCYSEARFYCSEQ